MDQARQPSEAEASLGRWWVVLWVTGAALAAASAFGPWVRTGRVVRSGFELAQSADRLDLASSRGQSLVLVAWFCLPLLAATSFTAAALNRRRLAAIAAGTPAAIVLAVGTLVIRSPLASEWGPRFGVGAAIATLLALAVDAASATRRG